MSSEDLADSKLIRPGSRVRHKLLMGGNESAVRSYQTWFNQRDKLGTNDAGAPHYRLLTPENAELWLLRVIDMPVD